MSTISTSPTAFQGPIERSYASCSPSIKMLYKKLLSQSLENTLDFSDSYARVHEILNRPQNEAILRNNPQYNQKLDAWHTELANSQNNHRKNLGRLMTDLKYIIGSLPHTDQVFDELDIEKDELKSVWDSDIALRLTPERVDDKMQDILKVIYPAYQKRGTPATYQPAGPNYTTLQQPQGYSRPTDSAVSFQSPVKRSSSVTISNSQFDAGRFSNQQNDPRRPSISAYNNQPMTTTTTYVAQQNVTPPSLSPRPSTYTVSNPVQTSRVYYIDPVTGERKERIEPLVSSSTTYNQLPSSSTYQTTTTTTNYPRSTSPSPVTYIQSSNLPVTTSTTYQPSQSVQPIVTTIQPTTTSTIYQPSQPPVITLPPTSSTTTYIQPSTSYIQPSTTSYTQPSSVSASTYTPASSSRIVTQPAQSPPIITNPPVVSKTIATTDPPMDKETQEMVNEAKRDFGHPIVEVVPLEDNPSKVEVAKDGKRIFYGGDSLSSIENRNGWLLHEGPLFDNKCCTIKSAPMGDTLVNNFENWDLVLLDRNLHEKGKLPGSAKMLPENYKKVRTRNSEDDNNLLWLSGPEHLSIVKTGTLTSNEIRNFWKFNGRNVLPVACAITPSGSKIVGIGSIDRSHTLHYYDGSDSVVIYQREDVHDKCRTWEALEINFDQDKFFLGGGDDGLMGYLICFTLNENCDIVKERGFPNARSISALRRHPEGDIIFAGSQRSVFVLYFQNNNFYLLNEIPLPIDRPVRDIAFSPIDQTLYTAHDYNQGGVIYFEDKMIKNRNSTPKPAPLPPRQIRKLGVAPVPIKPQVVEATPYDPLNQGYLTYDQRLKLAKKPPTQASFFKDFAIKQINLPGGSFVV